MGGLWGVCGGCVGGMCGGVFLTKLAYRSLPLQSTTTTEAVDSVNAFTVIQAWLRYTVINI